MKRKIEKFLTVLLMCIFVTIVLSACNTPYEKITEEEEKTILFFSTATLYQKTILTAVDNKGNMYITEATETVESMIENGDFFDVNIEQQISAAEVISNYNKLCKIDEELYFYGKDEPHTELEPMIYYYGVRYINGKMEILNIGSCENYTENQYAEEIVSWMEEWD